MIIQGGRAWLSWAQHGWINQGKDHMGGPRSIQRSNSKLSILNDYHKHNMKLLMMWTCIIHSTPHIILAYLPQFGDWVDQPRVAEVHQDHCHCNEVNAK